MKLLFLTKYLDGNNDAIIQELHIVLLAFVLVFVAMFIDLIFGVRAAKLRGEARTSYGFRRTTLKFLEYYAIMMLTFIIDVIASISEHSNLPYVTFLAALILVGIEAFSVYENFQNKKLKSVGKEDLKTLLTLIQNRDDILNSVIEAAQKKLEESDKPNDKPQQQGN